MVTATKVRFKGASGSEKALMSMMTPSTPVFFLLLALGSMVSIGCKPASSPASSREGELEKARKEATPSSPRQRVPREKLLLQLAFMLTPGKNAKQGPVSKAGCQLHILRGAGGAFQVAVDVGDLRRRTVYPPQKDFQRLPTYFPFGLKGSLEVEFHTSLNAPPPTAIPLRPREGTLVEFPSPHPKRWAFTCVLRQKDGPGVAIDGMFYGEKPGIFGNRGLTAETAKPAAIRKFLQTRVAR
ncbi:MAG: hypothetical protein JRH20_12420 [Deltaproteobacteria bacterium]|nr:hypothetical protein [Deltaproteobacteria bacterium]